MFKYLLYLLRIFVSFYSHVYIFVYSLFEYNLYCRFCKNVERDESINKDYTPNQQRDQDPEGTMEEYLSGITTKNYEGCGIPQEKAEKTSTDLGVVEDQKKVIMGVRVSVDASLRS